MNYTIIENPEFEDIEVGDVVEWATGNHTYYWIVTEIRDRELKGGHTKPTVEEAFETTDEEEDDSLVTFNRDKFPAVYKKTTPNLRGLIDS